MMNLLTELELIESRVKSLVPFCSTSRLTVRTSSSQPPSYSKTALQEGKEVHPLYDQPNFFFGGFFNRFEGVDEIRDRDSGAVLFHK